jgi:Gram-negative bacterial TonB protein C-terminal
MNLRSGAVAGGGVRPGEAAAAEPVALETTVIATGARPGDSTAKRELFTEETKTVLVFEHGAVIRLSAAVADGQLLFLTNKATGKEVVTQVLRKRSFRPTNCYVDLEFTEACPGFWGIEFPKAAKANVSDARDVAEKLSADEDSERAADKPTAPPSLREVERLKSEVAGLQTQLKSLQTGQNATAETVAKNEVSSAISAELAKKEEEKRLEELFALEAKQEGSNLPKRLVAYPKRSPNQILQKPGVRKSLIAVLAVALLAAGAYWFGAFDALTKKNSSAKEAASRVALPGTAPIAPKTSVAAAAPNSSVPSENENVKASSAPSESMEENSVTNSASVSAANKKTGVGVLGLPLNSAIPGPVKSSSENTFRARVAVPSDAKRRKTQPASELGSKELKNAPATSANNAGTVSSTTANSDAGVGVIPDGDGYAGPKLVRAVKPVAPAEALKNYITGNVNLDALVDATGHVKSVTVLSGPAKLRETAVEDMKQYVYEPAKKNGKAVPAHVQVSLQFWYEP